jgi:hypothetical protein
VIDGVLLAGVVVLAAVVVTDGLRRHFSSSGHRPSRFGQAAKILDAAGARGTLYVVDDACRLHAFHLPKLDPEPLRRVRACSVAVAPHRLDSASWSLWRPGSRLIASCHNGRVLVTAERGPRLPFIEGCDPAWSPTSALTLVRRGSVVQFAPHGRAEVIRPTVRAEKVSGIAWLGRRLAVVAGSTVAVYEDGRSTASRTFSVPVAELRAGRRGTRLTFRSRGSLFVLNDRLRVVGYLPSVRALDWSPDGHWLATAVPGGLELRRLGGGAVLSVPFPARDVAWR